ncbi:TPA: hypothetical protein RS471_000237 [Pseudomonas aeruginosa]|uniref:hypothetical protein n=1 Tax=Ectopseudomonas guguanensis TaxID=1198456 RepID=UPI0028563551|nr:hypothetical protein [Pseudomonas guguanensis]MDR8017794.1 hypothetical protein [Pseudomonas guguanensis]HDZ6667926.1 hypothetical protein [Pseudomonas aeruginosa]
MKLLRIFAAVFMFAGILTGCLALLLLVILMVRFPPLLIAILLACWMFCRLLKLISAAKATTASSP